jgi:hypothetical protein
MQQSCLEPSRSRRQRQASRRLRLGVKRISCMALRLPAWIKVALVN